MFDKTKKSNSKGPRKRITAKTVHNNFKIDFFAKTDVEPFQNVPKQQEKPQKKVSPAPKRRKDLYTLLDDEREYNKIVEKSERFYEKLLNYDSDVDLSKLVVFDSDHLDSLCVESEKKEYNLSPILNHPKVCSYGLIAIKPGSKCGPIINTRGVMVIIFVHVQDDMVFFESFNSLEKKKKPCQSQIQVLVIPNEVFVIHNESSDVTAKLLAISCKKEWKDFSDLKDKKSVPLNSM